MEVARHGCIDSVKLHLGARGDFYLFFFFNESVILLFKTLIRFGEILNREQVLVCR